MNCLVTFKWSSFIPLVPEFPTVANLSQLHHNERHQCERLCTKVIKPRIEYRVARASDYSQSGRSWYGHSLGVMLDSFNLRLSGWRCALRFLTSMVREVLSKWSSIERHRALPLQSFFDKAVFVQAPLSLIRTLAGRKKQRRRCRQRV